MTDTPPEKNDAQPKRKPGLRGHVAGIVALFALAAVAAAWFWTTRQPPQPAVGVGLPQGVMVIGAGAFVAALIAQIRNMSLADVLAGAWELFVLALAFLGALLKGIWNAICELFGWN